MNHKTGKIFIITGPSGAGKGTLINMLLDEYKDFVIPDSYTTRPPRPNEGTVKKYHFVTDNEFMEAINQGKILEYERGALNHWYGTDKQSIENALDQKKIVVVEVEPRGALNIKRIFNEKAALIFIAPTSLEILRQRILSDKNRGTVSDAEIESRMKLAETELQSQDKADYVVINEDNKLEETYKKLVEIITSTLKRQG